MKAILETHTLTSLKNLVRTHNIRGYSTMKKAELIRVMTSPQHYGKFAGTKTYVKPARKPRQAKPKPAPKPKGQQGRKPTKPPQPKRPPPAPKPIPPSYNDITKGKPKMPSRKPPTRKIKVKPRLKSSRPAPKKAAFKDDPQALKDSSVDHYGIEEDEPKKKPKKKPHGGQIESFGISKKDANKADPLELFSNLPEELTKNIVRQIPDIGIGEYLKGKYERNNIAYGLPKDNPIDTSELEVAVFEILFYGGAKPIGARGRTAMPKFYKDETKNRRKAAELIDYYLSEEDAWKPSQLPKLLPSPPKKFAELITADVGKIFNFRTKKGKHGLDAAKELFFKFMSGYEINRKGRREEDFLGYQTIKFERIKRKYPNANLSIKTDNENYEHFFIDGVDMGHIGGDDEEQRARDKRIDEYMKKKRSKK